MRSAAGGLVIDRMMDRERLEVLCLELSRRRETLPLVALETPSPERDGKPAPSLASRDRDEAKTALTSARAAVRRAGDLGTRFVVAHLGEVQSLHQGWIDLRDRFLRGALDAKTMRAASQHRENEGEPHLDFARAQRPSVRAARQCRQDAPGASLFSVELGPPQGGHYVG